MSKPLVNISIGLLLHRQNVLVGWRHSAQHQGNKFEFPGGKIHSNESPENACRREVFEEVGVDIKQWFIFDTIHHEYDDIIVNMYFFYSYIPESFLHFISSPWEWYHRSTIKTLTFPKANDAVIDRLFWSDIIKINADLSYFNPIAQNLFYWRVKNECFKDHCNTLLTYSKEELAKIILNLENYKQLPDVLKYQIKTIHLKQHQLLNLQRKDLEIGKRYIAACHNLTELKYAEAMGCDAALLSPIQQTLTHPNVTPLGWECLSDWTKKLNILVFALGGIHRDELSKARQYGAYGIAGIRHI